MQTQNETLNTVQNGQNEALTISLVNLNIINQNLSYIKNVASNNQTKNDLVSLVFFDYLENKAKYKEEMILNGFVSENIKNKDIAKYYFSALTKEVAQKLFLDYNVELTEVSKDDKTSFKLVNTKKTIEADNIIKGAKEFLRNNLTLLELISTNNLKLRIKLIDFRVLREIMLNLNKEDLKGFTLKALINNIDISLNDIEYSKALKSVIREVKENNKEVKNGLIDLSKLTDLKSIDEVIQQLKELKTSLIVPQNETLEGALNETLEGETVSDIKSEDFVISEEE